MLPFLCRWRTFSGVYLVVEIVLFKRLTSVYNAGDSATK
jgi:hypothetical protein